MEILKSENDFYVSVEKALDDFGAWKNWPGLIITGTHAPTQVEEKLQKIKHAREDKLPTLGICFGMQLMAIEYARNILGIKDATSLEIGEGTPVVKKLDELRVGIYEVDAWWGTTKESHWHNYYIDYEYVPNFQVSMIGKIPEIIRLPSHPFYVGVQFHPEYQSTEEKPHPLLQEFANVCKHIAE